MSTAVSSSRVNVQFTKRQNETLEEMAEAMGISKAGVLKKALSLLNVGMKERALDNDLAVIDSHGTVVKQIVGLLDD